MLMLVAMLVGGGVGAFLGVRLREANPQTVIMFACLLFLLGMLLGGMIGGTITGIGITTFAVYFIKGGGK